jgi:formamidopyrimidine-DNA glycosylase
VRTCYNEYMPELPEVETVRMGLQELIVGKTIERVMLYEPKSLPAAPHDVAQFVQGATITAIARRAKVLLIQLSSDYTLVIHLKMTGQLVYRGESSFGAGHPNDSLIGELPDRSTRVALRFTNGGTLYFNDQRKFGWIKLFPAAEVPFIDFMQKYGPEPLEAAFTASMLYERLQRRRRTSVKAALLDQTVLAGIGNIYADEALWGAGIHPKTLVQDISRSRVKILWQEIRFVLALSIEKGGSTDRNYVNAEGKRGSYIDFARVFRREGQDCPRCGSEILKMRVAGRGTHFCPKCQKV